MLFMVSLLFPTTFGFCGFQMLIMAVIKVMVPCSKLACSIGDKTAEDFEICNCKNGASMYA